MLDPAAVLTSVRTDLARLPRVLEALLAGTDDATWRARPAASEWAPVEVVCHLRDEETEDFGARLRIVVEGGDRFTPIDPERWAQERRYGEADPATAMADLLERRAGNLTFLATVRPERLRASVPLAGGGALSGLDLLAAWVTHDRLHLAQLAATLARLGAQRFAPLRAGYAGPIPYEPGPLQ